MILYFKVGTMPGKHYHVCYKRKLPVIGESFFIVDHTVHRSRRILVRLTEIRLIGGRDESIYFVELV